MAEPALALRDHPQIIDLISVLEQNGLQKQKEEVQALVGYDTGVSAEYGDQLITLSTCEYSRTNGRMVVVAKLLEE